MNTLYIDTRDNKEIVIRLDKNDEKFELKSEANLNKAQVALPIIETLLKSAKLNIAQLDHIEVETGPGSFTGLRVGVAIANALSFAGLITVNGKKLGQVIEPEY